MCSVEVIRKMNEVSSKIISLFTSRLNAEHEEILRTLRNTSVKENEPFTKELSDQEKNNIFGAYRDILILVLMNTDESIKKSKIFFSSLQEVMTGYPYFSKKAMDEKTKELYDGAFTVLKDRDVEASSELISCTHTLFN